MDQVQAGDVLVTDMTDPNWEPVMKRASAIVTNRGGRTCHAAIIARELGIPAVVGCGDATERLKDGTLVTVSCAEGDTGHIYDGLIETEVTEVVRGTMPEIATKIMMNVGNPQLAFDRLFRRHAPGKGTDPKEASVLDAVKEDAQRLKKRISLADRLKLEEYFDSVRAVEKRIAFDAARRKHDLMDDPACRAEIDKLGQRIKTYYDVPEGKRSIDHTEQVRLMMDLMALAFWTDATRVATFMFGVEVSGKNFSFIPGVSGSFHEISHHQNDKAKLEEYAKINAWHMEQYAYFLNRLRSFKEGDSDVLTNSITLCGAGIRDGNAHDPHNIPVILAGRGGGTIATGRHLVYEPNTAFCDVHLGIAHRMGLSLKEFGDSTQELKGLTDPTFKGTVKA
jgi:phosphohistidine swiveling domain-containing protein